MACYVVNTSTNDDSGKKKCVPVLEDYYECLHHKKEVSYVRVTRAEHRLTIPAARESAGHASCVHAIWQLKPTRRWSDFEANKESGLAWKRGGYEEGSKPSLRRSHEDHAGLGGVVQPARALSRVN